MLPPPAPPPLTELERRVLACGYDVTMGIDAACNNVRRWLRGEVDRRLRELAAKDPVERPCRTCGAPVEISPSAAAKSSLNPQCADCRWPERAAREDAEAVQFAVLFEDSSNDLAAAVAVLT